MTRTNADRAELAYRTLLVYQQYHPDTFSDHVTDSAIGDLLTDLRHLCDEYSVDFEDRIRFSAECYLEETGDAGPLDTERGKHEIGES